MNTLVSGTSQSRIRRSELANLFMAILKAFAPAPRADRSLDEERTLRRELWMLGGQ